MTRGCVWWARWRHFCGVFFLSVTVFLVSCHHEDNVDKAKKTTMDMKEFEEDLVVPQPLWKALESVYLPMALDAEGKSMKEGVDENEAKKDGKKTGDKTGASEDLLKRRPPLDPITVTVYLLEKTPGVLGGQNFELKYPQGGGSFDYRAFVPETKNGTFLLKVRYGSEMDPKLTKIFYLSNARVRDVGGQPMGNGCSRYFDVTKYWQKQMEGDGLALNTTDLRHISVTAGTLFFVAPANGKLRIAHLTVKDSRHRDLLCSSEKK